MNGIKEYVNRSGITDYTLIVFGGSDNDFGMIEYVAIGIAIGNSSNNLKRSSKYVSDASDNYGISKVLKYFKLIK